MLRPLVPDLNRSAKAMTGRYTTPKKASADQHAGCFFWSIYQTILELESDGTVTMYNEVLDEPGLNGKEKKVQVFKGKITERDGLKKLTIELRAEESALSVKMAVLRLKSGQVIADIHLYPMAFSRAELFEPV